MKTRNPNQNPKSKPPIRVVSGPNGTALASLIDAISTVLPSRYDYWSRDYLRCPDILNSTEPELVDTLYREYLRSGAEILISNTFLSNTLFLPHYHLKGFERSLCREGVRLAQSAARSFFDIDNATGMYGPDRHIYIAAPLPPLTLDASSHEKLELARSIYRSQITALLQAGAEELFLETVTDARIALQAYSALADVMVDSRRHIPVHLSFALGNDNRLPSGQSMEQAFDVLRDCRFASAGINCVFSPKRCAEQTLRLGELTDLPLSMRPAGSTGADERPCSPEEMADAFSPLIESNRLTIAGACCGATPAHVAAIRRRIDSERLAETRLNLQSKLN